MAVVGIQGAMQPSMQPPVGTLLMQPQVMHAPLQQHSMMLLAPPPQPMQQYPYQVPNVALELYQAVESLYRDGLRPYGRILKKRLAELAHASGLGSAERDVNTLRAACEACPYLQVIDGEGGDWAALIPGVPEAFVDVYSPEDCYPPQLWIDLSNYFSSIDGADTILPGGRYSCAQVLVQRHLPCLVGFSLGQVSHIVQLAISQKKLLGYLNGNVVPYHRSLSMVKDQSARCKRPCANTSRRSKNSAFATWDMMRPCLQQLLGNIGQPMPLSNLKRLFRAQFNVELSETALGHAKLSECLQDPRVRDLCDVKLQGQGYTIVPAKKPVRRSLISLADSLCMEPEEAAPVEDAPSGAGHGSLLQRRRGSIQHLSMDDIQSPPSSPRGEQAHAGAVSSASLGATAFHAPLCSTPVQTPFPPTPSPSAAYMRSLPRLLGRCQPPQLAAGATKELGSGFAPALPQQGGQPQSAADAYAHYASGVFSKEDAADGFDRLFPPSLSTMGLSVHNTFLHAPLPPPTPVRMGARFRARSLPREGTDQQ